MIDRQHLTNLIEQEEILFKKLHPKSGELFERSRAHLLGGVPMNWMVRWAGAWPVFVHEAKDARFWDVDGLEYVDFCLGDTGAMTGHSPQVSVDAISSQAAKGITTMLPSEEAILADLLSRNITTQVFRGLLENGASEQGARMSAMDNATRNAGDMINKLTIKYNRQRQANITKELIEIISGAEAL